MSTREAPPYNNKPLGKTTADYGASLREQIKAGKMTNAQAQAAQNAFLKATMSERGVSPAQAAALQSAQSKAAEGAQPKLTRGFFGTSPVQKPPTQSTSQQPIVPPTFEQAYKDSQSTRVDPGFAIDRPSMGGVKPGMSLAPTQTGSMAASGPPTTPAAAMRMKKGGTAKASKPVKKMAKGGSTASSRGDGCAVRGKTKGMMR